MNKNEELQKKIGLAQLSLKKNEDLLKEVLEKWEPLEAKRQKILDEQKYLKGRIEKLTKMLEQ